MMSLQLPEAKTYLPGAGRCIYCWPERHVTERLTREHIIAHKLGGKLVLHNASCGKCQAIINKEIEQPFLQRALDLTRTGLRLPTSNPKETFRLARTQSESQPPQQDLSSYKLNIVGYEDFLVSDIPTVICLPCFPTPGIFLKLPTSLPLRWIADVNAYFSPGARRPEQTGIGYKFQMSPFMFARLLAKIAHGAAVAELGFDAFKPVLPEIILGRSRGMGYLIGQSGRVARKRQELHKITLRGWSNYLFADIQLFARFGLRPYRVIVGYYPEQRPNSARLVIAANPAKKQ